MTSAMELGVAVWLTDCCVGIADLAPAVGEAGLDSLFLTEHTRAGGQGDVLESEPHDQDPRILDQFTALGAAAAAITSRLKRPGHQPRLMARPGTVLRRARCARPIPQPPRGRRG
jgi:alkanesulfonate monooxygenase SsuD/methylene tetrahydromethanopterin reductase-like flavin-dependent oxidoreductase (luciferase family)